MSRDRKERKHRRTWRHPESIAFMASANFDAAPSLAEAMGLEERPMRPTPCPACAALGSPGLLCPRHGAADALAAALRAALARLLQLGAEEDAARLGPCPACEQVREALAAYEGRKRS